MDETYSNSVEKSTDFLDYAERHGLALGGLKPKSKDPFEDRTFHPLAHYRRARVDWDRWLSEGMNLAIPAKPNGLFVIDIDVKDVGRDTAWGAYVKFLDTLGVAAPTKAGDAFWPHCSSVSGGWHVYVRLPLPLSGALRGGRKLVRVSDVSPQAPKGDSEIVAVRYSLYVVAPGSYYDGSTVGKPSGYYTLLDNSAPYECPPQLLDLMREEVVASVPSPDSVREIETLMELLPQHLVEKLGADVPEGERSEAIADVYVPLIAGNYSDDEIFSLIWDAPLGAKAREKGEKWLRDDIARCRNKGFGVSKTAAKMFGDVPVIVSPPLAPTEQPKRLIQSSAEFTAGFVAPSYLLDGILQRHFCYALTAATGAGKTAIALRLAAHVALGRKLGDLDVESGRVLYFAAENYVDVQARWIAMAEHCSFDATTIEAYFVAGSTKLSEIADRITTEAKALGDLALIIVDTSAATFEGNDENGNVDSLVHAKRMRSLTELQGHPTVLVLCHPVKSATNENLVPRGGGAFLAEIDGNLCARKGDSSVDVHWSGKFRGMDFAPMAFRLESVTAQRLKDAKGRSMPTVMATPIDDTIKQGLAAAERSDQDKVLGAIETLPGASSNDLAKHLGWAMRDGKPYGVRVRRAAQRLAGDGLIMKHRGNWVLSNRGEKELNTIDKKPGTTPVPAPPLFPLPKTA